MLNLQAQLFEIPIINKEDIILLLFRLAVDLIFAFLLIRGVYNSINPNKTYQFSYLLFNVVVFFVCYTFVDVKIKTGIGFGLFAVFSIMRYRTETIPIKEMTFLFITTSVAVINAIANEKVSYAELFLINSIIVGLTFVLAKYWLSSPIINKIINYEKIDLVKPEHHEALLNDLKERTGLDIIKFEVQDIDFLRDTAKINILYKSKKTG